MKYIPPLNGNSADEDRSYWNFDPATGVQGAIPTAAVMEHPQREILKVITEAGLTPDSDDLTQLWQAIGALIDERIGQIEFPSSGEGGGDVNNYYSYSMPTGTLIHYAGNTAPAGFVICEGTLLSRATYPALWTHAQASGMLIDNEDWSADRGKFSTGNGTTTFRVPDLRAEFLRGLDRGRGVDAGRVLGSWQTSALGSHYHLTGQFKGTAGQNEVDDLFVIKRNGDPGETYTGRRVDAYATTNQAEEATIPSEDYFATTGTSAPIGSGDSRPRNMAYTILIKA